MDDTIFLRSVSLKNLLSYGPEGAEIELRPLNVLIGANGSGKSNFIEALGLLRALPQDFLEPVRKGGGIAEWLWKGDKASAVAEIGVQVNGMEFISSGHTPAALSHFLSFTGVGQRTQIVGEMIENLEAKNRTNTPRYFYRYQQGQPRVLARSAIPSGGAAASEQEIAISDFNPVQSVLAQRTDPNVYPTLNHLAKQYGRIRLYTEWNLGRFTAPRQPQNADLPQDFLAEDMSNLALVLNDLLNRPDAKRVILDRLRQFYDRTEDITTKVFGGTVQTYLQEIGLQSNIPASRLSDGTLRYLCLLAVLCHPEPPPLVCIEEPELGIHPDMLSTIAELLVDASTRTQLVVTTHSDLLITALEDVPEAVIVCERDGAGSHLRRLESGPLQKWLKRYSLGELWKMGEIGGVRF